MDYYTYLRNLELMNQKQGEYDMSRIESQPWPLTFQNKSKQYLLSKAIENVKEYIMDETNDVQFYERLISLSPNQDEKKIIQDIMNDEKIHVQIFRKIFTELTGVVLPETNKMQSENMNNSFSYKEGLKKALFGELDAVKKYRETLAYMPSKDLSNMFMYVLTDEIRHADKYNFLISLNK
jgi:rubrerythrin